MKNINILGLLFVLALIFSTQPASAVVSVVQTNQEASVAATGKKELKKQARFEKMMNKFQKKMAGLIDRNDDTGKWLWWAIVLAIASVIASILFYSSWLVVGLWFLPSLLWTAASICFLIWLLKYLEII